MTRPTALARAASIADLRARARRRLPRFAFDFIDGGAGAEDGVTRNREDLRAVALVPRYLVDVSNIDTRVTLFGRTYNVPFLMAPVGFLNMAWPGADLAMARLCAERGMVHVVSTASSTPVGEIAEAAGGNAWFQLYPAADAAINEHLMASAERAGIEVLVLTVDVPVPAKRNRDTRNALAVPFKPSVRLALDLAMHPAWSLATLRHAPLRMANMDGLQPGGGKLSLADIQKRMVGAATDWTTLAAVRKRWRGPLLVKGIMAPDDALRCVKAGADGIIVSNHGGRQVEASLSSAAALPGVVDAVGGQVPVLLDSGVRGGEDAVRAKALGASAVLAGRAFAYGAGAGGAAGMARAFDVLDFGLRSTLAHIGRPCFADVAGDVLAGAQGNRVPS